jgi:hypothetical protein
MEGEKMRVEEGDGDGLMNLVWMFFRRGESV